MTEYSCLVNPPKGEGEDCGYISYGAHTDCNPGTVTTTSYMMTNSTACVDGYFNGFIHWCSIDKTDCAIMLKQNKGPVPLTTNSG